MKKIIVNADDFGPEKGICNAILKGFEEGFLSSTSVLVNFDDFAEYVRPLVDQQIPCGAHLNLFSGPPCSTSSFADIKNNSDLRDEFRAQIERLLASGARVTHIDNHRPEIYGDRNRFRIVVDLALEYGLPMRMPFRCFPERKLFILGGKIGLSAEELEHIRVDVESYLSARSLSFPDQFIPSFLVGSPTEEEHADLLKNLPQGVSEICVHPNFESAQGMREYNLLQRFDRARLMAEFGIELVSYADLP